MYTKLQVVKDIIPLNPSCCNICDVTRLRTFVCSIWCYAIRCHIENILSVATYAKSHIKVWLYNLLNILLCNNWKFHKLHVLGTWMRMREPLLFRQFKENDGQAFSDTIGPTLRRLYNRYNHCPCARPAHVAESWPACGRWPYSKCFKIVEVGCSCWELKSYHRDSHWRIRKEKGIRSYQSAKEYDRSCFATLYPYLTCRISFSDCSGCRSRPDKIYPNSWRQTFIDIHLFAEDRLELKFFSSHNFCSMPIKQLINLRKVRTENLKFGTDLWNQIMNTVDDYFR